MSSFPNASTCLIGQPRGGLGVGQVGSDDVGSAARGTDLLGNGL